MTAVQAKVVFPLPPPTTNSLTTQQRNQLLRKTKKLEQILGAAPHLLDASISEPANPVRIVLPSPQKKRSTSISTSRISIDSLASASASSSCSSAYSSLSSPVERNSSFSSPPGSLRRRSSTLKKPNPSPSTPACQRSPSHESWSETKPPFLRIALSDPPHSEAFSSLPPLPSKQYTLAPSSISSPEDSPSSPSFNINSMGSTRKSKMDRLRRKLGQGVPIELVFPNSTDHQDDSEESSSCDTSPSDDKMATFVYPSPRPSKSRSSRTIARSRDSLGEDVGVHHAPRSSSQSDRDSRPCSQPSLPPKSKPRPLRLSLSSPPPSKPHLTAIVESPDEHGSGCSEEFGLTRSHSNGSNSSYQWVDESEIKVWSTRRGYQGWVPPAPERPSKRIWSFKRGGL